MAGPPKISPQTRPEAAVRNRELLSHFWLERELPTWAEWSALREAAHAALPQLLALWEDLGGEADLRAEAGHAAELAESGGPQAGGGSSPAPLQVRGALEVLELLGWAVEPIEGAAGATLAARTSGEHAGEALLELWPRQGDRCDQSEGDGADELALYPPARLIGGLDRSGLAYGILTDGRVWRLMPRRVVPGRSRLQCYFEVDLWALLRGLREPRQQEVSGEALAELQLFLLFFSPAGFVRSAGHESLVDRAVAASGDCGIVLAQSLREQVAKAFRLCIEGMLHHEGNASHPEQSLDGYREASLTLLYRLLFILSAEARGLLPSDPGHSYWRNRSLGRHRTRIATLLDRRGPECFSTGTTTLWAELRSLFALLHRGSARHDVPAYGGGLFDPERHRALGSLAISDRYLAQVLDLLARWRDPRRSGGRAVDLDYRDLAIGQLGGIYEELLELRPVHQEGTVSLETDKGERRASGSYYTPDTIVDTLVQNCVAPACEEVGAHNAGADYAEGLLGLRVLDPAMGAGHFLLRACQFIAEQILAHPGSGRGFRFRTLVPGSDEPLAYWKRRVLESCLYGVDVNPLAVELAKLALWLETAEPGKSLPFIDHRLRCADSLLGMSPTRTSAASQGVRAGVGRTASRFDSGAWDTLVWRQRDRLFAPLRALGELPSELRTGLRSKERLFHGRPAAARRRLKQVADLHCGACFLEDLGPAATKATDACQELLREAASSSSLAVGRVDAALKSEPCATGLAELGKRGLRFLHWEAEFPEVFLADDGPGFDVILGNPPYDVVAARELGVDLSGLQRFIRDAPEYAASRRGKNNLYKLFLCRSLELLRAGGRLGFIVPMAFLGDDQASDVRRRMLEEGAFEGIDSFPQKDDPRRRVFVDAKLSTSAIVYRKGGGLYGEGDETAGAAEAASRRRFRSRVHPGAEPREDSPVLELSPGDLGLYDPVNRAIVSCAQQDWELVSRMLQSGAVERLGAVCESFQGEVNETTEGRKGVLCDDPEAGPLVLRGANISLYCVREASQGRPYHLLVEKFLAGKAEGSKARHADQRRIGFQRSSPQNNFRRLIAAPVSPGSYCFDTVSYVTEQSSRLPLDFLLALLNSKLLDWYFRLGSTNSKVNEYQLKNLPCPSFGHELRGGEADALAAARGALAADQLSHCESVIGPLLMKRPASPAIRELIAELCRSIQECEGERGVVSKSRRSRLAPRSQALQQLIDSNALCAVGFGEEEARDLERRLSRML